jgi:H+-transporting ATPase
MAEHTGSTAPKIDSNIESGRIEHHEEKSEIHHERTVKNEKQVAADDDEEDEDMDALIDELESQDGGAAQEEEEEAEAGGEAPPVPEELLQTDTRTGLTEAEVTQRRKKYGLNQMKEEKENLVLKFLGYFIGPIQFVMEVSFPLILCLFVSYSQSSPMPVETNYPRYMRQEKKSKQ